MTAAVRRAGAMLMLLSVFSACAGYRDWSGLTWSPRAGFVAVNNRPGLIARVDWPESGRGRAQFNVLDVEAAEWASYDIEGVAWLGTDRFAFSIEKLDNRCVIGRCELRQQVHFFRLRNGLAGGTVAARDACAPVELPPAPDDDINCSFANCGLEGIAADIPFRRVYAAREAVRPRVYRVELGDDGCAAAAPADHGAPADMHRIADVSVLDEPHTLWLLAAVSEPPDGTWRAVVTAYPLGEDGVPDWSKPVYRAAPGSPPAQWLRDNADAEGLFVRREGPRIVAYMMGESGAVARIDVPEADLVVPPPPPRPVLSGVHRRVLQRFAADRSRAFKSKYD